MKPKHLLIALLLPFALIAAACSDSESSSSDSSEDEESDATEVVEEDPLEEAEPSDPADVPPEGETMASPGSAMGTPPAGDTLDLNIAQIAAGTADVSTLTRLVIKGGLLATVRDDGPLTVFAPTNEAFRAVPADTLNTISADHDQLVDVLTLHVVAGSLSSEDLIAADGTSIETVNGGELAVEVNGDEITVGGATIIAPDIEASNGVIHVVDAVIAAPNG